MSPADSHDHSHDHSQPLDGEPDPETALKEMALRELLIEKGIFSAEDIRRAMEAMEGRGAAMGGRVVARAWTDPGFKQRLLMHANGAVTEFGVNMGLGRADRGRGYARGLQRNCVYVVFLLSAGAAGDPAELVQVQSLSLAPG